MAMIDLKLELRFRWIYQKYQKIIEHAKGVTKIEKEIVIKHGFFNVIFDILCFKNKFLTLRMETNGENKIYAKSN